jgi:PAS domain S-box-containing protein
MFWESYGQPEDIPMAENLNYEKLKQKLKKLEKETFKGKQAQKMLKRKITELDSFINNIPDMAWIKDESSRFIAVNRAFGEAVGMDQVSLIHQTCEICFGKERAKKFREDDLKVMKGRTQKVIEEKIINPQNNGVWLETVKSPILDHSGKAIGTVGISRDISKRKRAEERLQQTHDDMERIVKERTAELVQANEQLRLEIEERKKAQKEASYEQSLMQTLLNNIPDYIYFKDKNRRFVSASSFFCDLFGCSLEDIIGKKDEDLFPAEIAIESAADDRLVIETGIPMINKEEGGESVGDGGHWVLTTKMPWRDRKGNIIGLFGVSKDITDRKQTEETLRESGERYALATSAAKVGVWDWNIKTGDFYLDPNIKTILGYADDEIPNDIEIWVKYVHPEDSKAVMEAAQACLDGKTSEYIFEHRMLHKDGSIRWILVRGKAIRDENDNAIRLIGTDADITDRKQVEEALRESEKKIARYKKMESLGLLAGGVAHDLNNILSGIVSYPELLLLSLPEESKFRKHIEAIQRSGQRAAAVVDDLLTVARGVATTKEPLNLNDMVGDYLHSPEFITLKQFHPEVTFQTNLDSDLLNINGSHVRIMKAVMNLMTNASESIEDSGNVTISTMNRYIDRPLKGYDDVDIGEYVVLSVSDDGSGISPDDLERIFEPFYTKKVMGRSGTGLGLAVAWNVVQDHKGYISVTTDENGTTFELFFPMTREKISLNNYAISIEDFKGDGETILVVDDDESQRDISCKMLETFDYKTKAVSSGEETVEYLKENTVDLILLDMIMDPGINGCETYERIIKIHPNQKAIIVSGFAETADVKKTQKLGAGKYIKKPLTLERLGPILRDELGK